MSWLIPERKCWSASALMSSGVARKAGEWSQVHVSDVVTGLPKRWETWTWLHSPAFRATPLDIKAEADQHFLAGINQLIGHGWPYSPPQAGNPGWSFYAAAVFNDKNPWWPVM